MAVFRRRRQGRAPHDRAPAAVPAATGSPRGAVGPALRVLVVDDDADVRLVMTASLTWEGFEVVAAADGDDALELAATQAPDIVLLDLHLSDEGGLDLLPQLREQAPGCKVVVCSSIAASFLVEASIAAGATGFIVKGVSGRSIAEHLRRVAASGRARLVRPYPLNRDY